ncbi:MAG: hypothetical protein KJ900_12285 [Proteobacteria bacterium]|nr:hypothetical protein [Pseudomonadota bacterium]MBU4028493.1 hypothetical protein [Pseudomonadota bacterium]MBU4043655.1 hypothetical protein [Pseudomonadota bacterium]MBU4166912.1 hypothetical protein [Pseudomonadota bacterium]MCG2744533.1 hypothetical protein [Desulfobacteraceae bacterium]
MTVLDTEKLPDSMTIDEELMQATGKGDLDAFAEIVRRHQSWVRIRPD